MPKVQRPQLRLKMEADVALFAKSCVLLMHWQNAALARKLAKDDAQRALVAKAEADLLERTNEFLTL